MLNWHLQLFLTNAKMREYSGFDSHHSLSPYFLVPDTVIIACKTPGDNLAGWIVIDS